MDEGHGESGVPSDAAFQPSLDVLFAQFYKELRVVAARTLAREKHNHTLQPTELLHEVYRRLKKSAHLDIKDRPHFMRLAARVMSRHLIDHYRERPPLIRVVFEDDIPMMPREFNGFSLGKALQKLAALHPRQATVIECRFFAGLTVEEVAAELGVCERTVKEDTRVALAFLRWEMSGAA